MPVGQHQHVPDRAAGNTQSHGNRSGPVPGASVFRLHQYGIVGPVVGTLEHGYPRLGGVSPCDPDAVHRGLGAGVAEHHQVSTRDRLTEQLRQRLLVGGVDPELGPAGYRFRHGGHDLGMGVAEHVAAEPHGQVDVLVAVHVDDPGARSFRYVDGVGHVDGADHLEGDRFSGTLEQLARSGGAADELFVGVGHGQSRRR